MIFGSVMAGSHFLRHKKICIKYVILFKEVILYFQELLSAIREELLWAKRVPCERLEAPYESYRLDYTQFKTLYFALSPWAKGDFAEAITARMFKVRIALQIYTNI